LRLRIEYPRLPRLRLALRRSSLPVRVAAACAGALAVLLLAAAAVRLAQPRGNTARARFDVIIVLGTQADRHGNPTPDILARVGEGVREYERNVAPHLLFTGGAAHNQFVEARVMGQVAVSQGIPLSAIVEEPRAKNTIENACYSVEAMKLHGWSSAEVVSNDSHLPRVSLIFRRFPSEWRTHGLPPETGVSPARRLWAYSLEVAKTAYLLGYSQFAETCLP
jgi:uncharacterized SAM-binding protein YcdF (DUF218 family)